MRPAACLSLSADIAFNIFSPHELPRVRLVRCKGASREVSCLVKFRFAGPPRFRLRVLARWPPLARSALLAFKSACQSFWIKPMQLIYLYYRRPNLATPKARILSGRRLNTVRTLNLDQLIN
jgi:hypothetical protein